MRLGDTTLEQDIPRLPNVVGNFDYDVWKKSSCCDPAVPEQATHNLFFPDSIALIEDFIEKGVKFIPVSFVSHMVIINGVTSAYFGGLGT